MFGKNYLQLSFFTAKLCVYLDFGKISRRTPTSFYAYFFFCNKNSDNNRYLFELWVACMPLIVWKDINANGTKYQYSECIIKQGPVGKTFFPTLPHPKSKRFFQAQTLNGTELFSNLCQWNNNPSDFIDKGSWLTFI